jgi:hypothetical protein
VGGSESAIRTMASKGVSRGSMPSAACRGGRRSNRRSRPSSIGYRLASFQIAI